MRGVAVAVQYGMADCLVASFALLQFVTAGRLGPEEVESLVQCHLWGWVGVCGDK